MSTRKTLIGVLAVTLGLPSIGSPDQRDQSLERGIKQVEAEQWQPALASLSEAVRRLTGDPKRVAELADAYLHSGLAYVGLGETSPAISQFALALRTDPKIRIPAARESKAALDAFAVAQREAVAPPAAKVGKKSPLPFILAGAAVVGGGIALAAGGGGGGSTQNEPSPIPASFSVTGVTGAPQLLLLNTMPASASTIHLRQTAPILTFVLRHDATLPGKVAATAEMVGAQGNCITGRTGEATVVDRAQAASTLVVNSWNIKCAGAFFTTSMNVTLLDADAGIPVSLTSFAGGYFFEP